MDDGAKSDRTSAEAPPSFRLYSLRQVLWSTWLGGPLAGTWMVATNFKKLGDQGKSYIASGVGAAMIVAVVVLAYFLERRFGKVGTLSLGGVLAFATQGLAKRFQGDQIDRHVHREGRLQSNWMAVGVTAIGLVQVVFGATYVYSYLETSITIAGTHEIVLGGMTTEAEARKVGAIVEESGLFEPGVPTEMEVIKDRGQWNVAFQVTPETLNDPDLSATFEPVAIALREKMFTNRETFRLTFRNQFGFERRSCAAGGEGRLTCR